MANGKITGKAVDDAVTGARRCFPWDEELTGFRLDITPIGQRGSISPHPSGGRETKTKL